MAEHDLGTARGKVVIDASGVGKGLASANAQLDAFDKKNSNVSQNLGKTGTVMAGGGLAIAAGLGLAVKAASDFETRISAIAAVSGATGSELDDIRKKALQLGADTKYSAGEAAGAMEELIKAGLSTEDVMNGAADATVNLAAAGEVDLVDAATLSANAMNAFGLSAEQMPHIADLIAGAANASAIDVGEFGQSLQQVGAVANLAGLSFDDTAVAIAAMGNAGIKGSDAGTSLKTMLQNLQPQTEKQINLFKDLGIVTEDGSNQFYDAQGNVKSMSEIAGVLGKSLEGMTQQQKQATLETMFGTDAIRAAAVIADTGAKGMDDLAASMAKVSAEDVAKTRMDNLGGSIEQLKGSVETLMIIIGKPLADAMKKWVDMLTGAVNWIANLDSGTLTTITTILKIASAFLIVFGGGLKLISLIPKIRAAMAALQATMAANPVLLLVAALAALGVGLYLLYQRSEGFRNVVDKLFGMLKSVALPVINAVKDAFSKFWTVLTTGFTQDEGGTWFENLAFKIRDVAKWVRDVLLPAIGKFIDFMVNDVGPAIMEVVDALAWLVSEGLERVVGGFKWLNKNVFPVIYAFGELVWAIGERIVQAVGIIIAIITALKPLWMGIFNAMKIILTTAVGIMMTAWRLFGDNLMTAINLAWRTIKTVVEGGLRFIKGIIQIVTGIISGDWGKAWEGIKNMFGGVWDIIKAIPRLALDAIFLIIENALDYIHFIFKAGWAVIVGGVRLLWNTMRTLFGSGFDKVMSFIGSIPGKISHLASTIWDGMKRGAKNAVDGILNFFRDLPGKITGLAGKIGGAALGIGKTIINKLGEGLSAIAGFIGDIRSAVGRAVKAAINTLIDLLNDGIPNSLGWGPAKINLPDNPIPKLHGGGTVPGTGEKDYRLMGGESVFTARQTSVLKEMMAMLGVRSSLSPSAGSGGANVSVVLSFPNVGSAKDASEIKEALSNGGVLRELTKSLRAGVGANVG